MPSGIGLHVRRLILPIYLPMFLLSVAVAAPVAAFPQYLTGLGASLAAVGVVVSLQGIGAMIGDVPGGVILSRFRLRPVMATCFAAAAAAGAGTALARSVAAISVLVLLSGIATSIVVTAMMTYVRMTVPASSRGRALSGMGGAMRVGALVGPAFGGLLADRLGVPSALALRAACFAAGFVLLLASPDRPAGRLTSQSRPGLREQAAEVIRGVRGRGFALATAGFGIVVLQFLRSARTVFLPLWGDSLGLGATTIGAVMSAGAAMDLLLFVPAGMIMDRAGRKVASSLCIGLFSVGVLVLPLSGGLPGFLVASLLIGLGNGFGAGINMTLGTDLAPAGAVSTFLGAWRLFGDIGQSAGPAIVGALAAAVGLSASLVVSAGIGAAGLLVMAVIAPETLRLAR